MAYESTSVPVAKTREAIATLLKRHSITSTRFTDLPDMAVIEFIHNTRDGKPLTYRIPVKFPDAQRSKLKTSWQPKKNSFAISDAAIDALERQTWRVAFWYLKSLLEAIEWGFLDFETVMLPHMLAAGAQGEATLGEMLAPRMAQGRPALPGDPFGGVVPALPAPQPAPREAASG